MLNISKYTMKPKFILDVEFHLHQSVQDSYIGTLTEMVPTTHLLMYFSCGGKQPKLKVEETKWKLQGQTGFAVLRYKLFKLFKSWSPTVWARPTN